MYGIIDYNTKWVVCKLHHHRDIDEAYMTDYKQDCYVFSKSGNYVSKTNWYAGLQIFKDNLQIIDEERYTFITTECEKIMKLKSLLTTAIDSLVGKLPRPKIDNEITDVKFENE